MMVWQGGCLPLPLGVVGLLWPRICSHVAQM